MWTPHASGPTLYWNLLSGICSDSESTDSAADPTSADLFGKSAAIAIIVAINIVQSKYVWALSLLPLLIGLHAGSPACPALALEGVDDGDPQGGGEAGWQACGDHRGQLRRWSWGEFWVKYWRRFFLRLPESWPAEEPSSSWDVAADCEVWRQWRR